jgi:glycosyltransferase 2 family protein
LISILEKAPQVRSAARVLVRSRGARVAAQIGLIALCMVPVVRLAAADGKYIGPALGQVKLPVVLAAVVALAGSSLFLPAAMALFTRGASSRISYRHSALAYFGSQPMKYLPGAFWILPGRVVLLRRLGRDAAVSSAGLLFEMTTQVLSASLVVALVGLAGQAGAWYVAAAWVVLAASLLASLLLVCAPALIARAMRRPDSVRVAAQQLAAIPLGLRLRNLVTATALYAMMWGMAGLSFYALLVVGHPRLDPALLQLAVGVSTVSWLAGFLTPFSPGGVGVREAVIVLLLTPAVGAPQAIMVALLARALALGAELGFAGAAFFKLRSVPPASAAA